MAGHHPGYTKFIPGGSNKFLTEKAALNAETFNGLRQLHLLRSVVQTNEDLTGSITPADAPIRPLFNRFPEQFRRM